jgi:hypothetical protein
MYSPIFIQADSVNDAVTAILKYEQQDLTNDIAKLTNYLHDRFFSATRLINLLKEYKNNERTR